MNLPDWAEQFLSDVSALQLLAWVVGLGLLVTVVVKLWPFISNAVAIVDALVKLPALAVKVKQIHHETHTNDGSSIKDAVARVEEGVAGLHGRMDDVDRQLTTLATADEELWEEIERTQNPEEES